jgi:hypothetical protein
MICLHTDAPNYTPSQNTCTHANISWSIYVSNTKFLINKKLLYASQQFYDVGGVFTPVTDRELTLGGHTAPKCSGGEEPNSICRVHAFTHSAVVPCPNLRQPAFI